MTITTIPETRTQPRDVLTQADGYELLETVIEEFMDTGDMPSTVTLSDQNDENHEVAIDFIGLQEKEALEILLDIVDEDQWEDIRPIVEAILWQPKTWLNTTHDVEVI